MLKRYSVGIRAMGGYVPDRIVTNAELAQRLPTTDAWIRANLGIETRRIVAPDEWTSDLAVRAVTDACERADVSLDSIDLLIVGTSTPDHVAPPAALATIRKLDLTATGFDVNSGGCTGSVMALDVAARYVADGTYRRVAVVIAETMSKLLDWRDRDTAVIFGDGAACYLLERCVDGAGIQRAEFHSDASRYYTAYVSREPRRDDDGAPLLAGYGQNFMSMAGRQVLTFALENIPPFIQRFCKEASVELDDMELVLLHQANLRLVHRILDRIGVPQTRTMTNVEKYGNTSGAGMPLVLWEAQNSGRLSRGDLVLTVAFGTGMSYGAALIRWCDPSDFAA